VLKVVRKKLGLSWWRRPRGGLAWRWGIFKFCQWKQCILAHFSYYNFCSVHWLNSEGL